MNIPDEAPDTHCVDTPGACSPAGTVPGKLLQWMAAGTDLINMPPWLDGIRAFDMFKTC